MPRLFTGLEVPREVGEVLSMFRGGLPGARCLRGRARGQPARTHSPARGKCGQLRTSLARADYHLQRTKDGRKVSAGGTTLDIKFDGRDYPVQGEPHHTVSLKRVNSDTIEQTEDYG